jgi:diguanylate cyclase (GGDEF)-like protein
VQPDFDPETGSEVTDLHDLEGDPATIVAGGPVEACLVVIYTRSGHQLGQRVPLPPSAPVTLGRDSSADFVLDSERLSRRHCRAEPSPDSGGAGGGGAAWQLTDLDSTNGTYVNGDRLDEPVVLSAGDLIEAGGATLRFLCGANLEEQFRDTLLGMSREDGLTGLTNPRRLLEVLEAETARSRRYGRPLGFLILHVDEFKKVNARYGFHGGDRVLRLLAGRLRAGVRHEDTVGRFGMDTFGVVLPETPGPGAEKTAEHLRELVEHTGVDFDEQQIHVTVSVGGAQYEPEWDVGRFVEVTSGAAEKAKAGGRNRIYLAPSDPSRSFGEIRVVPQKLLEPRALLHRTLSRPMHGPLLGFELEDEPTCARLLGTDGLERWLSELADDVRSCAPAEALVGRWGRRNVVVALTADRPGEGEAEVRRRVLERFGRREVPAAHTAAVTRALRVAQVGGNILHEHGEQAFELLAGYLGQPSGGIGDLDTLPFPLVAARAQVSGCPTPYGRVRTLLDGLDAAVRFLCACQLAWVRDSGDQKDLAEVLRGAGSGLGAATSLRWADLCWKLATLLPEDPSDAVCIASRHLVVGSAPSPLAERLREAASTPLPKPGTPVPEKALERPEVELRALFAGLARSLRTLGALRLVTVKSIVSVERGDIISYALRLHRGPLEYFPVVQEDLQARLRPDSCYLLREAGRRPLLLAPIVFARSCEACARTELFLSEGLVLGPDRAEVSARSVTRGHEATFELPWSVHMAALYTAEQQPAGPAKGNDETLL